MGYGEVGGEFEIAAGVEGASWVGRRRPGAGEGGVGVREVRVWWAGWRECVGCGSGGVEGCVVDG